MWEQEQTKKIGPFSATRIKHDLLLVPEAPVLISLLLIGWVYGSSSPCLSCGCSA
jgi:hypothetical protein